MYHCQIASTTSKRDQKTIISMRTTTARNLGEKLMSLIRHRSQCCRTMITTECLIAKWSTIIIFHRRNYEIIETELNSIGKWSTIITSERTEHFGKIETERNPFVKPNTSMVFKIRLFRRYWKDIPGPVLFDLRVRNETKHERAAFFHCSPCKREYNSRRSIIRMFRLQKAPSEYPCKDCENTLSQKTIQLERRTMLDSARKLYPGQMRHYHYNEQSFFRSLCKKAYSSVYSMGRENPLNGNICDKYVDGKHLFDLGSSCQGETRHFRCASRKRCFKTAKISRKRVNDHCNEKPARCEIFKRSHLTRHRQACTEDLPYNWKVDDDDKYPRPKCKRNFVNWPDKHEKLIM